MDADDRERMDGLTVPACERCPELVESRSRIVDGTGPDDADLLFVGEGPGQREDERGEPFVGRSGSVLDDELRSVGLERESVRITNCVRCRPPENRDPTAEELEHCRGYLEVEIERVDPEVIVTLGKVPGEHLLGRSVSVTNESGSVEEVRIGDRPRRVLICLHPAATLYDRSQEETFAEAIETAADLVGGGSSGGQSRLGEY
ncbi:MULTISPECIES: uracil-DNA glycosylase [Saliphagus]|uniref:Type-4 uracil-DNA glycosylase n=1 Tax=Saliphagus infecundisoli TaxID=1849069 RepID=A0ABD5QHD2_9EURY|nr:MULTISPECIES: uracil-DNA glycosylase [Saliphagus]